VSHRGAIQRDVLASPRSPTLGFAALLFKMEQENCKVGGYSTPHFESHLVGSKWKNY
jgi:hypothetical protein